VVVVDDQADDTNMVGAGDGEARQNPGPSAPRNLGLSAPPTSPTGGMSINAQLDQSRDLEAKLAKQYRVV
jgi:hypothetical protein